jgi:ATP-binding cassette subfamily B protein IrtB
MINDVEELIQSRAGLRAQIAMYVTAAVIQGLTFATVIPALRALFGWQPDIALAWTSIAVAGAVLAGAITWVANNAGYTVGIERMGGGLMHRIGRRLPELPLGWFTDRTSAAVTTVMGSSIQNVLNLPSLIIQQLTTAVVTPATVVLVTALVDPWLAVAFLPMVPLAWILYRRIDRVGRETDLVESTGERDVTARVLEFTQAQAVLRSAGQTQEGWAPLDAALERDRAATLGALQRKGRPTAGFLATVSLGFAVVVVVAVSSAIEGRVDVATFAGVLVLAVRFIEPLSVVGAYGSGVTTARTALAEIRGVVAVPGLAEPPADEDVPADSSVEFLDVTFAYGQHPVLEHFSLRCEPGTTTALVGASGSGKSTAARLVGRFWDVAEGEVRVGGVDVRRMTTTTLMKQLSFVFQHVYLMDDTILANVRIGRPTASDQEVMAAARAARLDEVIERLPDGWSAAVGEGGKLLSGGERQRVSIARAILKNAPIVLLDEATASLDSQNEAAVTEALRVLSADKTVLVIAHRLDTIAHADRIAVIDGGHVADSGTHQELIARPGLYARFWADRLEATRWKLTPQ